MGLNIFCAYRLMDGFDQAMADYEHILKKAEASDPVHDAARSDLDELADLAGLPRKGY